MAVYTPGETEDDVVKTTASSRDIDLTAFTTEFTDIKEGIQALPKVKTVPDQETLDHWNNWVITDGSIDQVMLDSRAVSLYNEAAAIREAGLLPAKYEDEYQQLKTYVENL